MTAPLDPWIAWSIVAMSLAWCASSTIAAGIDRLRNRNNRKGDER